MIQYYINSKPVPYLVARNRLSAAYPSKSLDKLSLILSHARKGEAWANKFIAVGGISISTVRN